MSVLIALGRFLFSVLFIFSGASKLLNLPATTQAAGKFVVPEMLVSYTAQLEQAAGMPFAQMLALAAGGIELLCGLLIALNFGARFCALVLIVFVAVGTYYFHDFWNQTGPDAQTNLTVALKNLSLVGGLLIIAGIGRGGAASGGHA
ncbi:DoxX family protein [Rhodopseudomonas palustris]|uniref:DoxX family protein n=1 Tax=Rhodopseudomonas palustris TaxID=1076 RepID=UPI00115CB6C2|nr:DoxX family protein [Rhodopseudomonas palustris]QDL97734.1 DoxX family protein [Rhodopseudomonas palustris]